jgi:hypothetical protein
LVARTELERLGELLGGVLVSLHVPIAARYIVAQVFVAGVNGQGLLVVKGQVAFALAAGGHAQTVVDVGQFVVQLQDPLVEFHHLLHEPRLG